MALEGHNCNLVQNLSIILYLPSSKDVVMKYLLIIAVLLSFTAPVKVQAVEARGYLDCGQWLAVRTDSQRKIESIAGKLAVVGYLSGLAVGTDKEFFQSGNGLSNEQVMFWLDNYCRENPLDNIYEGANTLFRERTGQTR
jgi:hypothetical protein